jgi:hypothetical protein
MGEPQNQHGDLSFHLMLPPLFHLYMFPFCNIIFHITMFRYYSFPGFLCLLDAFLSLRWLSLLGLGYPNPSKIFKYLTW